MKKQLDSQEMEVMEARLLKTSELNGEMDDDDDAGQLSQLSLSTDATQALIQPMNPILSPKSEELCAYAFSLFSVTISKHLFSIPSLVVLCDMWLQHAFACLMGMSAQVRGIIYWTAHTSIMCTVWKISLRLIVAAGISGFVRLLQQETWQWDSVPSCIMLLSIFSKFGIYR